MCHLRTAFYLQDLTPSQLSSHRSGSWGRGYPQGLRMVGAECGMHLRPRGVPTEAAETRRHCRSKASELCRRQLHLLRFSNPPMLPPSSTVLDPQGYPDIKMTMKENLLEVAIVSRLSTPSSSSGTKQPSWRQNFPTSWSPAPQASLAPTSSTSSWRKASKFEGRHERYPKDSG